MDRITRLFTQTQAMPPVSVELLPLSGSNRKYYRVTGSDEFSCIAVIGVDAKENETFCNLSAHFRMKGINVPRVLAISPDYEVYLQEDLGDSDLNSLMAVDRTTGRFSSQNENLLLKTIAQLPMIQFEGAQSWDFNKCYPSVSMNARKVMFDLNYFKYCFLKPMGVEFNEEKLQDEFEQFVLDVLSENTNTFLYRDFQSRNIMVKGEDIYFIDFQGGMRGPFYYDLASFVYQFADRYPEDLMEKLVDAYYGSLQDYYQIDKPSFKNRLNIFILLRHLQVLGCYGFRGLIEKKQYFIDCVPDGFRGIEYILKHKMVPYPYMEEVLFELLKKRS